jgi:hypothetical protein
MTSATPVPASHPRTPPGPLSAYVFDTTPGAHSALAPPAGFAGDGASYITAMRHRYHTDPAARQCILLAAFRSRRPFGPAAITFTGPYAEWARHVVVATSRVFTPPSPER